MPTPSRMVLVSILSETGGQRQTPILGTVSSAPLVSWHSGHGDDTPSGGAVPRGRGASLGWDRWGGNATVNSVAGCRVMVVAGRPAPGCVRGG